MENKKTHIGEAIALHQNGYVVLPLAVSPDVVLAARESVLSNIRFFKNTRPNPFSSHLAGFHRYPALEWLHGLLASNAKLSEVITATNGGQDLRTIGLSDITINRSQEWHTDLLRGRYSGYLKESYCWGAEGGGVFKALLYLQGGKGLKVIAGAHLHPRPLGSDEYARPNESADIVSLEIEAGDLIVMDLRLPHRGGTEDELMDPSFIVNPKILVSTVLGFSSKPLTRAMELGNYERLNDWDRRHINKPARAFAAPSG